MSLDRWTRYIGNVGKGSGATSSPSPGPHCYYEHEGRFLWYFTQKWGASRPKKGTARSYRALLAAGHSVFIVYLDRLGQPARLLRWPNKDHEDRIAWYEEDATPEALEQRNL